MGVWGLGFKGLGCWGFGMYALLAQFGCWTEGFYEVLRIQQCMQLSLNLEP